MALNREFLEMLRSPGGGERLREEQGALVSESGRFRYAVNEIGIPLFAEEACSEEGRAQQRHYDRIAGIYMENLAYPHTKEYMAYLDRALLGEMGTGSLGTVAEVCCGGGEAFTLLEGRFETGVGIDVSVSMLRAARSRLPEPRVFLLQADATCLPLADECVDNVVMLGGIHHVSDRVRLFSEIRRVLRPGGRLFWREPANDFLPWRALRGIVYRMSPTLDHETERPLRYAETVPPLERAGFTVTAWRTYGFLGFCILMNSDVLVVNRVFRYIPGIRWVTRAMVALDDLTTSLPGLRRAGLQVVGVAQKSAPAARPSTRLGSGTGGTKRAWKP